MTDKCPYPELDDDEVVNTADGAKWLGISERRIRDYCKDGVLKGAYQASGQYRSKWLIPVRALRRIRFKPKNL